MLAQSKEFSASLLTCVSHTQNLRIVMPKILSTPARVNISIDKELHTAAVSRAAELRLRGGFSEYVTRLLNKNLSGKGRDVLKMPRFFSPKRKTGKPATASA